MSEEALKGLMDYISSLRTAVSNHIPKENREGLTQHIDDIEAILTAPLYRSVGAEIWPWGDKKLPETRALINSGPLSVVLGSFDMPRKKYGPGEAYRVITGEYPFNMIVDKDIFEDNYVRESFSSWSEYIDIGIIEDIIREKRG
jgi:hypothetical protein